jgi:Cft2 family RNA processing exonuclease
MSLRLHFLGAAQEVTGSMFLLEHDLHANVEVLDVFSAHAGRDGLLRWAEQCRVVRSFFLVHGEPDQQEPLRAKFPEHYPVVVPARGQVIELD